MHKKTDKTSYNEFYNDKLSPFFNANNQEEFMVKYEQSELQPLHEGGRNWFGYTRRLTIENLFKFAKNKQKPFNQITVLDAGCGLGSLSVYLALCGFNVFGIDISKSGIAACNRLAKKMNVMKNISFFAESLENTSLPDNSIDCIIGHGSMHHFVKYGNVPNEFMRIMKKGACGYFAESFGENKFYHLFHKKKVMERLGDVVLTRKMIYDYLNKFDVKLTPTDWFVMFDKFFMKYLPKFFHKEVVKLSKISFLLDRRIPKNSLLALYLSNSVLVEFKYNQ